MNKGYVIIDRTERDAMLDRNEVPVYLVGNYEEPLGSAKVKRVSDVLMARFRMPEHIYSGLYPSGIFILIHGSNDAPKRKKLIAVSLSISPNIDAKINPLP